jgi:hypothetical protein
MSTWPTGAIRDLLQAALTGLDVIGEEGEVEGDNLFEVLSDTLSNHPEPSVRMYQFYCLQQIERGEQDGHHN